MKTNIICLALVFGVLLSFSCKKEEGTQSSQAEASESARNAAKSTKEIAYVLRLNSSICSKAAGETGSETDKTKWVDYMSLGEKVEAGNTRKLTYEGDGKVYEFTEIRRENGNEGNAFAWHIAVGGSLAVVTNEKANLFKTPKTVDVSGEILPRKTIVVYYPETEKDGFVKIKAYNPETRTDVRENNSHVRLTSLSRKNTDIQAAILLQTALALSDTAANKIRKEAILESAVLDYPDSVFYEEIYALAHPNADYHYVDDESYQSFMLSE